MTEEVAKYFCNICPFQTRTKGYLKMHVENKHKIFACQQCDFKSKGRLAVYNSVLSICIVRECEVGMYLFQTGMNSF